jgi:hypothetical protein
MTATQAKMTQVDEAVGAAFLASGVGSITLGILVVLADASAAINTGLGFVKPVGALSGKTSIAVIAFLASWVIAHFALRGRGVKLDTTFRAGLVMVIIGVLLTFPPVFEMIVSVVKPMFGG